MQLGSRPLILFVSVLWGFIIASALFICSISASTYTIILIHHSYNPFYTQLPFIRRQTYRTA
ncbi:hypothetical protein BDV30DRAFT_209898 [Aspergillus minisclerotigenes]|uniref:Uncharacterized protein n=1 Tax=Aspergillus minisclerotigenes TaxID=656917 RepID=A0A5N6J539_9EURO|nr:hypothetical protein BDV30DRAFT_209898 [Aspergillus minisclerotigenes]